MSIKVMETKTQLSVGNAYAERNLTSIYAQNNCGCATCVTFILFFLLPVNMYESPLCQVVC